MKPGKLIMVESAPSAEPRPDTNAIMSNRHMAFRIFTAAMPGASSLISR
jgi:hypothetical protein